MKVWTHKNRMIYDFSLCKICGSAGGTSATKEWPYCNPTPCLACHSVVCMSHGLGNGTCPICYVGLLPGWSGNDRLCDYKSCFNRAVARVRGQNRHRCLIHLERDKKYHGYVERQLAERADNWEEVELHGR